MILERYIVKYLFNYVVRVLGTLLENFYTAWLFETSQSLVNHTTIIGVKKYNTYVKDTAQNRHRFRGSMGCERNFPNPLERGVQQILCEKRT